jgi:hypothetical protein
MNATQYKRIEQKRETGSDHTLRGDIGLLAEFFIPRVHGLK